MSSADLLLHPVRLRVVQLLLNDRVLTTGQLHEELPGIPVATLYRHVAALVDGGVLEVVEERRVRGAGERMLRLKPSQGQVGAQEAATLTPDQHRQAFLTFVAGLLADFERYVASGDVDLGRDLVGYSQVALHLSDAELLELLGELSAAVAPRLALQPGPGRTRRVLTSVVLPSTPPGPPGAQ